jgi:hypothetical protein
MSLYRRCCRAVVFVLDAVIWIWTLEGCFPSQWTYPMVVDSPSEFTLFVHSVRLGILQWLISAIHKGKEDAPGWLPWKRCDNSCKFQSFVFLQLQHVNFR